MTRIFRTSLLILPLLLASIVPPSVHAIMPQDSAISWRMQSDDFADRGFSSGFELFYAGPEWFLNALSNPRARNPFVRSFPYDSAGDRLGAENGYVGTLRDVFDVGLFGNISTFVGPTGGKTSGSTPLSIVGNDYYWDVNGSTAGLGGTGTWDVGTTAFWNDSSGTGTPDVWTNGKNAFFSGTAGTVTVSGAVSALTLNFTVSGYTIDGNTLTLTSTGTGTASAINATNAAGTNTISAPLTLGSAAATTATFTQAASGTLAISGNISSTNAITGISLVRGGSGTGTFTFSGNNSYSGNTSLTSDTRLNINSATAISSGALVIANANTTIDNTGGAAITLSNNNAINLSGGSLTFTGTNDLSFGSGVVTLSGAASRSITVSTASATLTVGAIVESGGVRGLTKLGPGTLSVTGNSTYTGTTSIAGTLKIENNGTSTSGKLAGTTGITINSTNSGTLLLSGSSSVTDRINDNATMTLSGGTFNTGGLSEVNGAAGSRTPGIGALTLTANSTIDFGTGTSSIIEFAGLGAHTPISGPNLLITNWTGTANVAGGTDQLLFAGLITDFVTKYDQSDVTFNNVTGYNIFQITPDYYEVTMAPEPSTWIGGALALGAIGVMQRRRFTKRSRVTG